MHAMYSVKYLGTAPKSSPQIWWKVVPLALAET